MTAFFLPSSPAVTWCCALLDGKILDLVCSGERTHTSQSLREGLLHFLPSNNDFLHTYMYINIHTVRERDYLHTYHMHIYIHMLYANIYTEYIYVFFLHPRQLAYIQAFVITKDF